MEDRIYDSIGKRFTGDKLSSAEEQELNEWLKAGDNQQVYEELQKAWELSGKAVPTMNPDVDAEWKRFIEVRDNRQKTRKLNFRYLSIAASIAIFLSAFFVYRTIENQQFIKHTASRQNTEVQLPDGSHVWLNRNSELAYRKKFGEKARDVQFSGEAIFEVSKSAVPFRIYSQGNITTEVLGTKFNLRAYETESQTELTVIEGRVSFGKKNADNRLVMEKGTQASVGKTSGNIEKNTQPGVNNLAWHTRILTFDNAPLVQLQEELSRYFGVAITLPDQSEELKFSGHYTNPDLEEIAEILDLSFHWNHKLSKTNLVFTPAGE